ncbi:UNVERIFIED_CONTAM: hypothetical protein GTU68_016807, partial [Idotea baltica]|nr:hypothetical protein [Idotea baltica]
GDPAFEVQQLAPIATATSADLSFVVSARYKDQLAASRAGAVILPESIAKHAPGNFLVSANPYASYARASWLLTPESRPKAGVHELASVDPSAVISPTASIGQHCVISADVSIGAHTRLFPRVTVYHDCVIGDDCRVQSGAVLGAEGFGFAFDQTWQPIHQTGRVVIGNKVHVGANTTIDRGAIDDTVICDGVILDNQIQIAHNVQIGENTAIAGCVGIAGSTRIGANCQIGGASNIVGHINIVDGVVLNATSFVSQSIDKPGRYSSGMPLQTSGDWKRTFVILSKLNDLLKRVRQLERN